jgi:uncharacterized membrane protein
MLNNNKKNNVSSQFWYTKCWIYFFSLILFVSAFFLSFYIPPMQSPDEFNHVERAYLISKGEIGLAKDSSGSYGGYIDKGLIEYMDKFRDLPYHPERKLNLLKFEEAKKINWSGELNFLSYVNTPLYNPFFYIPQAVGFKLGEKFDLAIHTSYKLARFFSLIASMALIISAAIIFPMPPLAFAVISTPIFMFQLGTTSPDGIAYSLAPFALAIFSRAYFSDEDNIPLYLLFALAFILLLTRYFNFFPAILLPMIIYFCRKNLVYLFLTLIIIFFSLAWINFTLQIHTMPAKSISEVLIFYFQQPFELVKVYFRTITRYGTLRNTLYEMVGRLGWLDVQLTGKIFFVLPLAYLAHLTIRKTNISLDNLYRKSLFFLSIIFYFLLLFMLLIAWTPHPAYRIDGIAGRYFTPILFFIAYAYGIYDIKTKEDSKKKYYFLILSMVFVSFLISLFGLIRRYYT